MSKYWDPDWETPTVVHAVQPDQAWAERTAALLEGSRYAVPDEFNSDPCMAADGTFRMATVGPDHIVLVRSTAREAAAELQRTIGRLTFYFICTRPRITLDASQTRLDGERIILSFVATLDDGTEWREVVNRPYVGEALGIEVRNCGETLVHKLKDGSEPKQDASLLAQGLLAGHSAETGFMNLRVRYIGRARGEIEPGRF